MKISVIPAHPRPGSFNHAIADAAVSAPRKSGHRVIFHDLYREKFDPLLPSGEIPRDTDLPPVVAEHCREIASADGIVIVHPDWWGMPPAIPKGRVDRVLRSGVAYRFRETDAGVGVPEGLLAARAALVFNTSDTPAAREQEVFGDPPGRLWNDCIFAFCGVPAFRRRMFRVIVTGTDPRRQAWPEEVREMAVQVFPPDGQ